MNGFLNILKPPGMTSAAVVGKIRRMTGEKHVGHAGTLDPEAAGVLPIMVGKAARLFDFLVEKEKVYVAEAAFGCSTDTQDATGHILEKSDCYPDYAVVCEKLKMLEGDIVQRPSIYSAVKMDGKPMYERARKGETVEVPERLVHVEKIEALGETPDHGVLIRVRCGRGTYIRSICDDLGKLCGCPAHMRFLLRASSGAFTLDTAMTLEEAESFSKCGTLNEHFLAPDWPLKHLYRTEIPFAMEKLVRCGSKIPLSKAEQERLPEDVPIRIYLENAFWGIAVRERNFLVWKAQIAPEI